jgi:hypothetical protein
MTVNAGRTNIKFVGFWLDNSGGTLTDLTAYLKTPGSVGPQYDVSNVEGVSDGSKNIVVGIPAMPLSIEFVFDTVVLAHLTALNPLTPLSLDVRYGIRQAQVTGEPQFGISMSTTSGYVITGIKVNGVESITATFDVYGPTAPAFGTTNET